MLVNKTVEFFLSEAADWTVSGGGLERDAGDQITWQAAGSERPGTGRDADGGRGLGQGKMPAGKSPGRQRAQSGQGPDGMPAGTEAGTGTKCRRGPRLSRQGAKRS